MENTENKKESKKIYRSTSDRIVFGVCGGLAEYFSIDPILVRVAFVVLSLASGIGIFAYLLLAIFLKNDDGSPYGLKEEAREFISEQKEQMKNKRNSERWMRILGTGLVFLGFMFLLNNIFPWGFFKDKLLWPISLFLLGLLLISKSDHVKK